MFHNSSSNSSSRNEDSNGLAGKNEYLDYQNQYFMEINV
jgi:hypothetical protein